MWVRAKLVKGRYVDLWATIRGWVMGNYGAVVNGGLGSSWIEWPLLLRRLGCNHPVLRVGGAEVNRSSTR